MYACVPAEAEGRIQGPAAQKRRRRRRLIAFTAQHATARHPAEGEIEMVSFTTGEPKSKDKSNARVLVATKVKNANEEEKMVRSLTLTPLR